MSYEECQELKNIKYKTMLLSGNKKNISSITNEVSNLDLMLDNESKQNKKESWNKLDKSVKMTKVNEYIDTLVEKHNLSLDEQNNLKDYLSSSLDKKSLHKNKDVVYIKETGKLESIPILQFNNVTRKFSLKKQQQQIQTSRSLGPTRKINRAKVNNSVPIIDTPKLTKSVKTLKSPKSSSSVK
jgi:hypothetical protein